MGLIDWWRRKGAGRGRGEPEEAAGPVAAYDRRLDSLSSRAAELRRAVATLLAARAEIARGAEGCRRRAAELESRLCRAVGAAGPVARVLEGDLRAERAREAELSAELVRLDAEASALCELVRQLESEAEGLRRERATAQARVTAARALAGLQRAAVDPVDERLELERARDEVERARALAEICGEDLRRGGKS